MNNNEKKRATTYALLTVGLMLILFGSILAYTAITNHWSFPSDSNPREETRQAADGTLTITARYWRFEPSTITTKKGETVRLQMTSTNNMMPMMTYLFPNHGIEIEGYDIDYILPVGETVTIEFVADKTGEFHFHCSIYCGIGHEDMHGELIVEE